MGGTAGGFTSAGGGLFGATQQKPGGLFGAAPGATGAFGASTGFGSTPAGSFGASMPGAFGATTAPFSSFGQSTAGLMQQANPLLGHASSGQSVGSVHDYIASLTANPYGDDPLFKNLVPGSQSENHLEEILKPTNPAAQKALLLAGNQYKISPHRNVKVKPKPILSSIGSNTGPNKSNFSTMSNSPLFDGLEDDDVCSNKNDLFVPRRSVKKLVIKPRSPGLQANLTETRTQSCTGIQTVNNISNDESLNESVANFEDSTCKADDVSLNLPPVMGIDGLHTNGISPSSRNVEGSFLDTRKKKTIGQSNNLSSPSPLSDSVVPSTTSTPINPTTERSKTAGVGKIPPNLSAEAKGNKQTPSVRICTSEESVLDNDSDNDSDDPRDQMDDGEEDDENEQNKHPAKIKLKRSQYYTMPSFSELASITDKNGDCIVENFVIGRGGYGNIFFPGMTNIAGMNFDEMVIFRHKEVFVYPDDKTKPMVGEGLNKKAQVTLDKVWPIDKTLQNPIKSPEKLVDMNYEEKLRKACIKMGARFVEYRPDQGSWVFNVEHFSKYGLQDSDEEEEATVASKKGQEGQKRLKTLQLRSEAAVSSKPINQISSNEPPQQFLEIGGMRSKTSHTNSLTERTNGRGMDAVLNKSNIENSRLSVNVPSLSSTELKIDSIGSKVKFMKAASLFDSQRDMDIDGGAPPPNVDISKLLVQPSVIKKSGGDPRPIILESRSMTRDGKSNSGNNPLDRRDMEDIAHSILTGSSMGNRGLGGNYSIDSAPPTLASSLLRSQYLPSTSAALNLSTAYSAGTVNTPTTSSRSLRIMDTSINHYGPHQFGIPANTRTPSKKLPRYSLQSGYDKYVSLPTSGQASNQKFNRQKVVKPHHVDTLLPLNESIMNPSNIKQLADYGLFMSRSFRVGWSNQWILANPGKSVKAGDIEQKGPTEVIIEQQATSSYGVVDQEQLNSLEAWLEVCLEHSNVMIENNDCDSDGVPLFKSIEGIEMLSAFADEASRQGLRGGSKIFSIALEEAKQVWDLMVALWGHLPYLNEDNGENMELGEEWQEKMAEDIGIDSHEVTMRRKEALSDWLKTVVEYKMKEHINEAKQDSDKDKSLVAEELANLSGNNLKQTCDRAQIAGDHYSAMLTAQSAGGSNSVCSQMLFRYMEQLQEVNADSKLAVDRLHLFALISGTPVWQGSGNSVINTSKGLDWKRAFAITLWFLSTPSSSIADALADYEAAFLGHPQHGQFAVAPKPAYDIKLNMLSETSDETYDIKFHILKLYSDRSHGLENIITPATHTGDQLDHRLGWFVGQVLRTLGYRHLLNTRDEQLHMEFASQLESMGLWHWSVFVLLHLNGASEYNKEDTASRKASVCQVLGRNVGRDEDSIERERFLQEQLHLPRAWIAEAKAIYASTIGNFGDQAWYLIQVNKLLLYYNMVNFIR